MAKPSHKFDEAKFRVRDGQKLQLKKIKSTAGKELTKSGAYDSLADDVRMLQDAQNVLYASSSHSVLIILQGMDAAGKDSTVRHVMGAINPQGCRVYSFKAPTDAERSHHFLWRAVPCLPAKGMMSIFNRSYYEETLAVRVHPEFLKPQQIPGVNIKNPRDLKRLWTQRFEEIRNFEATLAKNGTLVLKFFLHISKDEQKQRFLERLERQEKHYKFNARDLDERKLWKKYAQAFEAALSNTSTKHCPWYIIPSDSKWYARAAIADIIASRLEGLKLRYPKVSTAEAASFKKLAKELMKE